MHQRKIGVVGLGAMGAPMAQHLLDAGTNVVITSSRNQDDLLAAGAVWADSPAEVGRVCDMVLLMLPDIPEIESVLTRSDGLLKYTKELLILVGSTASPVDLKSLADAVRETHGAGINFVDCPVSGGVEGAQAGSLSIMIGGETEHAENACEVLQPCGTPVHLGPLGAGQVAKACNQMVVAATMMAIGEATVLAERSGIDIARMWRLLAGGYAASRLLDVKREKVVNAEYAPGGMAKYMVKDLNAALEIAKTTETRAVMLPPLSSAFIELNASGYGASDIAVTRRFIDER